MFYTGENPYIFWMDGAFSQCDKPTAMKMSGIVDFFTGTILVPPYA